MPVDHNDIVLFMLAGCGISHPTVLFRRSAVLQVGTTKNIGGAEDYDLWLRVAVPISQFSMCRYYIIEYMTKVVCKFTLWNKANRLAEQWMNVSVELRLYCMAAQKASEVRLRAWRHPYAIKLLYQIAQHLQHSQNRKLVDISEFSSLLLDGSYIVKRRHLLLLW